jgi:hypothetical protein
MGGMLLRGVVRNQVVGKMALLDNGRSGGCRLSTRDTDQCVKGSDRNFQTRTIITVYGTAN